MKKLFLVCTIMAVTLVQAAASDSLALAQREDLLFTYLDQKNTLTPRNAETLEQLIASLEAIVSADNGLIDSLKKRNDELERTGILSALNLSRATEAEMKYENNVMKMKIFFYSAILLAALLVLFIILYVYARRASRKLTNKIGRMEIKSAENEVRVKEEMSLLEGRITDRDILVRKLHREADENAAQVKKLLTEIDSLKLANAENEARFNNQIELLKSTESNLLGEKLRKDSEIMKLKDEIAHLQKEMEAAVDRANQAEQQHNGMNPAFLGSEEYNQQLAELNLKIQKINSLNELMGRNIISREEFEEMKQKFLNGYI